MTSSLMKDIQKCQICKGLLPLEPRPILQFNRNSRILVIGQAPGLQAHETNSAWNDLSGDRLRSWLGLSKEQFYNPSLVALVPMGFCYPGRGKSGDLPPRKECAKEWMVPVRDYLKKVELEIYIGKYACDREFGKYGTLTDLIRSQYQSKDNKVVLPHPSPRNNIWLAKNKWFEKEAIPYIQKKVKKFF